MKKLWQVAMNSDGTHFQRWMKGRDGDIWMQKIPSDNTLGYDRLADNGWASGGRLLGDYWLLSLVDLEGWKS